LARDVAGRIVGLRTETAEAPIDAGLASGDDPLSRRRDVQGCRRAVADVKERPPPPLPAPLQLSGGVGSRPLNWRGFGRLTVDFGTLSIRGLFIRLDVRREQVRAIRISRRLTSVRASVIWADGFQDPVYFTGLRGEELRLMLRSRAWPIEEYRWGRPVHDGDAASSVDA
jgi:hypothetical protein